MFDTALPSAGSHVDYPQYGSIEEMGIDSDLIVVARLSGARPEAIEFTDGEPTDAYAPTIICDVLDFTVQDVLQGDATPGESVSVVIESIELARGDPTRRSVNSPNGAPFIAGLGQPANQVSYLLFLRRSRSGAAAYDLVSSAGVAELTADGRVGATNADDPRGQPISPVTVGRSVADIAQALR